MDKWNEEDVQKSPLSWILKLEEQTYLDKINAVKNEFQKET